MSFEFMEEENNNSNSFFQRNNNKENNINYLVRWGIAKDEKQAQSFLLVLLISIIIVTIFILQFDNIGKIKPTGNIPTINYGQKK